MFYKLQMLALFAAVFIGSQVVFAGETAQKTSRIVERSGPSLNFRRSVEVVRESKAVEPVEPVASSVCEDGSCRRIVRSSERTSNGRRFRLFRRWR